MVAILLVVIILLLWRTMIVRNQIIYLASAIGEIREEIEEIKDILNL